MLPAQFEPSCQSAHEYRRSLPAGGQVTYGLKRYAGAIRIGPFRLRGPPVAPNQRGILRVRLMKPLHLILAASGVALVVGTVWFLSSRPRSSQSQSPAAGSPWTASQAGTGVLVSWDRKAAPIRDAQALDIIIDRPDRSETHAMSEVAGALVIPAEASALLVRVRVKGGARDGEVAEVFRNGQITGATGDESQWLDASPGRPGARSYRTRMPMTISRPGQGSPTPVFSDVNIVLPSARQAGNRPYEIELFLKVDPRGKVVSATSRYYGETLGRRLAALATASVMKWRFARLEQPSGVDIFRDARVRLRFGTPNIEVRVLRS